MKTVPRPGDLANAFACRYDAWNRLVEVKDGARVHAMYEYDGLNHRVKTHVDSDSTGGPDAWRHFYYTNDWQVLETRVTTSAENDPPETLQPEYQFVWSLRYIDAPVLRDKDTDSDDDCTDSGGNERLYYATDANQNVTALVEPDGDVAERYEYDPYGKPTFYDGLWTLTQLGQEPATVGIEELAGLLPHQATTDCLGFVPRPTQNTFSGSSQTLTSRHPLSVRGLSSSAGSLQTRCQFPRRLMVEARRWRRMLATRTMPPGISLSRAFVSTDTAVSKSKQSSRPESTATSWLAGRVSAPRTLP